MLKWFRKTNPVQPRDPMDHPEIARMSPRELADLPLVAPMSHARQAAEEMARPRQATRDSTVAPAGYCLP